MASTQEVIEEKQATITPSGKQVVRAKTETSSSVAPVDTVNQIVFFLTGIVELLLAARFVFKLLGANPNSGFVSLTYGVTNPLSLPFRGIFPVATTQGVVTTSVLEPSTIAAMVVYIVLAYGIVQLVKILSRSSEE